MRTFLACALIVMCVAPVRSQALELHPSAEQVATALQRGRTAATVRPPPVELYSWFGPPRDDANEFRPRGFLMTKLSGLAVLSATSRCALSSRTSRRSAGSWTTN